MASSSSVLSRSLSDRDLVPRPGFDRSLAVVASTPQIDSGVIIRGLKRYGWWILALSVIFSAPLMFAIYKTVEPTYEAISRIEFEPTQLLIYDPTHGSSGPDLRTYEPYLETQISLMKSDQVLNRVIHNPLISKLPLIARSDDALTNLREKMKIEIEPNTYMITVGLESKDPHEAAQIVNEVVASYLDANLRRTASRNANLKENLRTELKDLKAEIDKKKTALHDLHQKGTVQVIKPDLNLKPLKSEGDGVAEPTFQNVGEQQIKDMIARMVQVDVDLITLRAELKTRLEAQNNQQAGQDVDSEFEAEVKRAVYDDPDVKALGSTINDLEDKLKAQQRLARKRSDPALRAIAQELAKAKKEWEDLWATKSEEIRQKLRLLTEANGRSPIETIAELQQKIKVLEQQKVDYAAMYDKLKLEQKTINDDSFQFAYAQQELTNLLIREEKVKGTLAQVEFQSRQEPYRLVPIDKAEVPKTPSNNKRLKYMLAAPLGILFLMLGIFLLLEIRSERVADPDTLELRVRSEVYALPPLPTSRELRRRSEPVIDDQIERFIQRLDHLRFAVCGNSAQPGNGRCVLITSAIGGEGKTTLAAQLAARCGNAGMSTLLIDADLRRGSLCSLLDIPDGLGLSDVLKGESATDEVVVPVQGGAFCLLRAGTPIRDTSALLQDQRFGMLIAQLRQLYDLIIIDSPPVLPIPDALILGRWTDGAVLAARYDISRFPQVERARRQLDNAGVTVLGTVINGMRRADSYYGKYTYSRRHSSETDLSNTS